MLYQLVLAVESRNGCQTWTVVTDYCCSLLNDPECLQPVLNYTQMLRELSVLHCHWWTGWWSHQLYAQELHHWMWSVVLWVSLTSPVLFPVRVKYQLVHSDMLQNNTSGQ